MIISYDFIPNIPFFSDKKDLLKIFFLPKKLTFLIFKNLQSYMKNMWFSHKSHNFMIKKKNQILENMIFFEFFFFFFSRNLTT